MSEQAKTLLNHYLVMDGDDIDMNSIQSVDLPKLVEAYHQSQSQWISVEERLPDRYCQVLIYWPRSFPKNCRTLSANYYDDSKTFYCDAFEDVHDDVTHWMPEPSAPLPPKS